jgi:hypothetical protein
MYNNCQHLNINIVLKDSILYYYLFTYITRCVARGVYYLDNNHIIYWCIYYILVIYLRNKSWKVECVSSFNMGWRILVFNPEPEASMNYFDSDMSKSTNTVVYVDWKTVIYIYVYGICRTQFMLPNSSRR